MSFIRSSPHRCFIKKGVLSKFAKFTGKYLCQSLLLKKRLWHRCFPVNFANFLRKPFLQNNSGRLFPVYQFHKIILPDQVCRFIRGGSRAAATSKMERFVIIVAAVLDPPLFPVDTGRKLNVHKTFRRRPGRLLNVLCTINLRPVSTGFISKT